MINVETKILAAIKSAEKEYGDWSNGESLYYAPEYFITTSIARKIRGIRSHDLWVTMEHGIKDAVQQANALKPGRPSRKLQLSGRYDLVIWRKNNTPRFVVEVKHNVTGYNKALQKDVSRICEAFSNPKNKMQCGMLAFYTSTWTRKYKTQSEALAEDILYERVEKIYDEIKNDGPSSGIKVSMKQKLCYSDDKEASMGVVIRFQ